MRGCLGAVLAFVFFKIGALTLAAGVHGAGGIVALIGVGFLIASVVCIANF